MPTKHLPFGGSTMTRTIKCPGWRAQSGPALAVRTESAAANEGSALHEAMESIVAGDSTPEDWEGTTMAAWGLKFEREHVELLESAMDAYEQLEKDLGLDEIVVEPFVELDKDLIGGSADVIACGPDNVVVVDWKFGYNEVDATSSYQGATYILAAMEDKELTDMFDGRAVHFAIIQPKVSEVANVYRYSLEELADMRQSIFDAVDAAGVAAKETLENRAHYLNPGDHCMFCPGSPTCPKKLVQAHNAVAIPADAIMDLPQALALAQELEPWVKEVKNFAHEMLEKGAEIDGWKLVEKRATRKWDDLEEVTDKLNRMRRLKQSDYADVKVKTPPQLEKVCKAKGIDFEKEFGPMIVAQSSGTTLAPASDKRPAVDHHVSVDDMQKLLLGAAKKETIA